MNTTMVIFITFPLIAIAFVVYPLAVLTCHIIISRSCSIELIARSIVNPDDTSYDLYCISKKAISQRIISGIAIVFFSSIAASITFYVHNYIYNSVEFSLVVYALVFCCIMIFFCVKYAIFYYRSFLWVLLDRKQIHFFSAYHPWRVESVQSAELVSFSLSEKPLVSFIVQYRKDVRTVEKIIVSEIAPMKSINHLHNFSLSKEV